MADAHAPGDSRSAIVLLGKIQGKEINLIRREQQSVRIIRIEGMKLPHQLEGGFSSVAAATHIVESYLAKVKAKEIKVDGSKYPEKKVALSKRVKV